MKGNFGPRRRRTAHLVIAGALAIWAILGPLGTTPSRADFSDVPSTYWAAVWINFLVDLGLVKGLTATTYGPTANVTRDQMAVFIGRTVQELEGAHGMGWVNVTGTAGTVEVSATGDLAAVPDSTQADPGLQAGYRLLSSSDGITFAPAANATFEGIQSIIAKWQVTGVTATTFFEPAAVVALNPEVDLPLTGILTARPSQAPASITITQPPSTTGVSRVPELVWNPVPGAVIYALAVTPSSPAGSASVYSASLAGWRTSLLVGYPRGAGILAATQGAGALSANTSYELTMVAVDATGWAIGVVKTTFTTGT